MRKQILILAFIFLSWISYAQSLLTLEDCYEMARVNYPSIKQKELIERSKDFSIANVRAGLLPQFSINAQATYQSEVTEVPFTAPGFNIETLSKDQYRVYGEVTQSLYDGGINKSQRQIAETSSKIDDQKLEVELYQIKERINQLYFGILLDDEQMAQVRILQKDLSANISRTESAVRNGTAFRMSVDLLQAEYLKAEQRVIELQSIRQSYLVMLGTFINQPLTENTQLQKPEVISPDPEVNIIRPEMTLFSYQQEQFAAQYNLNKTQIRPRVGFFLQGGYGRPALNQLNNEFNSYYLGGVRLNWSLSGIYNSKRDRELLDLNIQRVNVQRETFLFGTSQQATQQKEEITKLQKLIEVDNKIIALRTKIKETAQVQQDNGVITTNDYLRELNAEDQAKQNKLLHEMQLLMALYAYQNTIGN